MGADFPPSTPLSLASSPRHILHGTLISSSPTGRRSTTAALKGASLCRGVAKPFFEHLTGGRSRNGEGVVVGAQLGSLDKSRVHLRGWWMDGAYYEKKGLARFHTSRMQT